MSVTNCPHCQLLLNPQEESIYCERCGGNIMRQPDRCERCGEPFGDEARAEVYRPMPPVIRDLGTRSEATFQNEVKIVHAEPCFAPEMENEGWKIA